MRRTCLLMMVALGLLFADAARAQQYYRVLTNLGSLGGADCRAVSMNDQKQVVGSLRLMPKGQTNAAVRAFLWQQGFFNELAVPGPDLSASHATAINGPGDVAGWFSTSHARQLQPSVNRAFLWRNGELTQLGALGGANSFALSVNDGGEVVGSAQMANGQMHACVWRGGTAVDLGTLGGGFSHAADINSNGEIVGVAANANWIRQAFLWKAGSMTNLGTLGGSNNFSQATCINDRGDVAGVSQTAAGQVHAFVRLSGTPKMRDIGTLGGDFSFAYDNNSYEVVGVAKDAQGVRRAFIYRDRRLLDLNTLIPPDSGVFLIEATAINQSDQIICTARARDESIVTLILTPR